MLPFWSEDGRSLGFFAGGKLKKLEITSRSSQALADALYGRGGTWNAYGTILFSSDVSRAIYRVASTGGDPVEVTSLDKSRQEFSHRWPQFLPDGHHFLYFAVSTSVDDEGTYVASLDGGMPQLLLRGSSNAIYASGYLLFVQQGVLMARRFDVERLSFAGDPRPAATNVSVSQGAWKAVFSTSETEC
jgi:Tol biopolymer transport system component